MFTILGNIYDRSVAIVFGATFFSTFWRLWKLVFFDEKFLKVLYLCFLFIQKQQNWFYKNLHNSRVVGCRKPPNSSLGNFFNLLSIGLRYTLSFEWPDFGLKHLLTVMLKDQPPKFKVSIRNFLISKTDNRCNSLSRHADSNWVIVMDPKRKSTVVHVHFKPVSVSEGTEIYL